MKNELSWMRRFQKQAIEAGTALEEKTSLTFGDARNGLTKSRRQARDHR